MLPGTCMIKLYSKRIFYHKIYLEYTVSGQDPILPYEGYYYIPWQFLFMYSALLAGNKR